MTFIVNFKGERNTKTFVQAGLDHIKRDFELEHERITRLQEFFKFQWEYF